MKFVPSIILGAVLIAILGLSFKPLFMAQAPKNQKPSIDQMEMKGFDYTSWDTSDGVAQAQYKIQGDLVHLQDKPMGILPIAILKEVGIENPKITFFNKDKDEVRLEARYAVPRGGDGDIFNFAQSTDFDFKEGAKLSAANGNSLQCDQISWNKEAQIFNGEGNCFLYTDKENGQSERIVVNIDLTKWEYLI